MMPTTTFSPRSSEIGAQAAVRILQAEEDRAVVRVCRYWSVSSQMRSTSALCASRETCAAVEPRGETVDRVAVAVELGARGADAAEQPIVGLLELLGVRVGSGRRGHLPVTSAGLGGREVRRRRPCSLPRRGLEA